MPSHRTVLAAVLVAAGLAASSPARAAALQQVTSFGSNPSGLNMFIYVPDRLASPPPVVVAIHYCGGSASAFYSGPGAGLVTGANQYGYIVIFPETVSVVNNKCWDVYSTASFMHNGGSDSAGIVSMVRYAITQYSADASRVYAMGTSSGAMMTNVLLGAYPDLFKAGSAWSGVPFGCFAGTGFWNSACANGQTSKTGPQWGDLVRAAFPAYSGYRPRIQLWHGDVDATINFNNFGEAIKQWTNVHGLSETPTSTEPNTPQSGYTRTRYANSCGFVEVEAVREAGQDHNLTVLASEVIRFFGLATPGPDPGIAGGCDGGVAGGTGGTSGSGGASGDAGVRADAGADARDGNQAAGGRNGAGGLTGQGGSSAGTAGASGGTSPGTGGSSSGAGGTPSGSDGGSNGNGAPGSGCSCATGPRSKTHGPLTATLVVAAALATLWRRRRARAG